MDLHDQLKRPECKTLAVKRDLSSRDGPLKKIVTFANTAGGTLLIRAEDRSRYLRGVTDGWILQNREASNLAVGRGSYSQHNTVVHKEEGLYCGIPHRNTILMNRADMARAGFTGHQRVTVQGEAGALQNVEIIPGESRSGAAMIFYPVVNTIFKAVIDSRSGTPAFKRVPVLVRAGRGAVADGAAGRLIGEKLGRAGV